MVDNDNLDLSLTCAICLDIASVDDAVETSCCHNLFCLTCIENVQPCPTCRTKDYQTVPAYFARRLIGNMTVLCPNKDCDAKINRSSLSKHLAVQCVYSPVTCPDSQCNGFKCAKKDFLEHLTNKHEQVLLDNFEKLWQKQEDVERITIVGPTKKPKGKSWFFAAFEMLVLFFSSCRCFRSR